MVKISSVLSLRSSRVLRDKLQMYTIAFISFLLFQSICKGEQIKYEFIALSGTKFSVCRFSKANQSLMAKHTKSLAPLVSWLFIL